jgi:glycosyl transferase family 87
LLPPLQIAKLWPDPSGAPTRPPSSSVPAAPTPDSSSSPPAARSAASPAHDTGTGRGWVILFVAIVAVAAVRIWFSARLPVNTADVLRSIHTALYVLRDGPAVAGVPLVELDPGLQALGWARVPYSYPPLVLPFFVIVAAISPTLFAAKLALTLVEAVNASLIARITGSRWLGVLYWASPASIWWASGEGQFEPLMAFFMLAAVAVLRRSPAGALALLALGFHIKLTAILLLPWCLLMIWRNAPGAMAKSVAAFVVVIVAPFVIAGLWYSVIDGLLGIPGTIRYNPYYWNFFDATAFLWNPGWLVSINALATYAVLGFMIWRAWRTQGGWAQFGGAIAFVVLVKVSTLAQFWYFLLFPAFVMPIEPVEGGADVRWWLVALTPLLDVRPLIEILSGPFGWSEVQTYFGFSAFTRFGVR